MNEPTVPTGFEAASSAYFKDLAASKPYSPKREQAAAHALVQAKADLWAAIFDYLPHVGPIVDVAEADFGTIAGGHRAVSTARALRDRETRDNIDRHGVNVRALSRELARLDPELELGRALVEDLNRLARTGKTQRLDVRRPPRGSARFARHLEQVRAALAEVESRRNAFAHANLRLVVSMVGRAPVGLLPRADLVQEGNIGLLKAVDRFDPDRGLRFSTYASWWIRHAINRALSNRGRTVRVPAHLIGAHYRIKKASAELESKLQRAPTDEEIAADVGLAVAKVRRARRVLGRRQLSLDAPLGSGEGPTAREVIPDQSPSAEALAERASDVAWLRHSVQFLSDVERDILHRRFAIGHDEPETLQQIAGSHGLSRERIRQIQNAALAKLRRRADRPGPVESPRH